MSKRYAPIIIALIIAALSIWGHIEVKAVIDAACTQLGEIHTAAENEDIISAQENIKKLLCDFEAKQHVIELFIKRENVTAVSVNLHGLYAYANKETFRDLMSEADKAAEQLRMLEHMFFSMF